MKNDYEVQALAVNTVAEGHEGSELGEALREAEVTLLALKLEEKKILIMADLIKVAEDFIADTPVDRGEVMRYQDRFKKLLEKIG